MRDRLDFEATADAVGWALALLAASFPEDPGDCKSWPEVEALMPSLWAAVESAAHLELRSEAGALLMARGAEYLTARGRFQEAEELARNAFTIASGHPSEDLAATMRHALGTVLVEVGALKEAREALERALEERTQAGVNEAELRRDRLALGEALGELGELSAARDLIEAAAAEIDSAPDRIHCWARRRLAWLLMEEGEFEKAERCYGEVLAATEDVLGHNHPDAARVRGELGALLLKRGEWKKARDELHRALSIARESLGSDHPAVGVIHSNLGGALEGMGRFKDARTELEQALTIGTAALPEGHRDLWLRHRKLCRVLATLGDFEGARREAAAAVEISERALVPGDADWARDQLALAGLLVGAGDLTEARQRYEQALPGLEGALGASSLEVAAHQLALGQLLARGDNLSGARQWLERALSAYEEQGAAQALAVRLELLSLVERLGAELASSFKALGREEEGEKALKLYRAIRRESLEEVLAEGDLVSALAVAGSAGLGMPDLATSALREAQEIAARTQDAHLREHQRILVRRGWSELGLAAYMGGDTEVARKAYEVTLELAGDPAEEGEALHDLGDVELEAERPHEAIELYLRALERKRQDDVEPLDVAFTLLMLGRGYEEADEYEEATKALEQCLELLHGLDDPPPGAIGTALHQLAAIRREAVGPRESIHLYQEAAEHQREAEEPSALAQTIIAMGQAMREAGEGEAALEAYREGLDLLRSSPERDFRVEGGVLEEIAELHHEQGDLEEAISRFREAVERRRVDQDEHGTAYVLLVLAVTLKEAGRLVEAEEALRERLVILRSREEELGWQEGISLRELGDLRRAQGDLVAAIELYREAVESIRDSDEKNGLAYALRSLARALVAADDQAGAEQSYREQLELLAQLPERAPNQEGITRHELARVLAKRGALADAAELMREAVAQKREAGNTIGVARSLAALAGILEEQDREAAREASEEAVRIFRAENHLPPVELAWAIMRLAILLDDADRASALLAESEGLIALFSDGAAQGRAMETLAQARKRIERSAGDQ
jgi:tetratricopeptide (TPR) repeat protein